MTDTPALVKRLRELAHTGWVGWHDSDSDTLRQAADLLDALSLGVARQPEPDNDVGLAEERRQFNARIRELEQERDEWKAGRMADHTGHMFRCARVNGIWNCQKGCAIARAEAAEHMASDVAKAVAAQSERAEAAEQALAKLDDLCEEVRTSHRDQESTEYNQCEDGECAWCQETKAALALAGLQLEPETDK